MAQFFSVHPEQPQPRLIKQAAEIMRKGGLIAFPTDSAYALGGITGDNALLARIRRIRGVDERHHFTLMCRDLSEIATYARVDNSQYRLLKATTPGPYTFILEGTKELPRRVLHPKRKTIGLRVPEHPVVSALLAELGEPDAELHAAAARRGDCRSPTPRRSATASRRMWTWSSRPATCGGEATTVIDLTQRHARAGPRRARQRSSPSACRIRGLRRHC
jgi:tRNA threonylcarbamoyl adenosine modification protein (Sua5/YciO/YrdC/YwlC family)